VQNDSVLGAERPRSRGRTTAFGQMRGGSTQGGLTLGRIDRKLICDYKENTLLSKYFILCAAYSAYSDAVPVHRRGYYGWWIVKRNSYIKFQFQYQLIWHIITQHLPLIALNTGEIKRCWECVKQSQCWHQDLIDHWRVSVYCVVLYCWDWDQLDFCNLQSPGLPTDKNTRQ